jgi:hypothetical protein
LGKDFSKPSFTSSFNSQKFPIDTSIINNALNLTEGIGSYRSDDRNSLQAPEDDEITTLIFAKYW